MSIIMSQKEKPQRDPEIEKTKYKYKLIFQ